MPVAPTELFAAQNSPHARYAVDLLTRLVKAREVGADYDLKGQIGPDLWSEVCHAIGWDIDWDKVNG
jgi:hypothetical protein